MNAILLQSATDQLDDVGSMASEVAKGLSASPKQLPSKFFYDAEGSRLFEEICRQPEYYLTRTEIGILVRFGGDIARVVGPHSRIVEFGSGSGVKTRLLIRSLAEPAVYAPVEISPDALKESLVALRREFPGLPITPVVGDFTQPLRLPVSSSIARRTVVFFPGSTIGNFDKAGALRVLRNIRGTVGSTGGALVGIDLRKDVAQTEAAYNDAAGVTARFTLNMLAHLNTAVGTDFDLTRFAHRARYNVAAGRIETYLISLDDQTVLLQGATYKFKRDEAMLVEYSHKYTIGEFEALAARAALSLRNVWTDDLKRFAIVYLSGKRPGVDA
ncbi:L-histidine N(alpha)-methyltransferase [Variovorax sp. Sphag1AA]|uniref:L-histidine N(alpha)-methyltransferase n=1 Tax=Variovorax sp. Sphag1AA TaxID=2587027 RepID=UPI001616132C|nr:L-histidine N(alpha)-methyltransferase [Variovorax sp. Sphag1AA]MBB3178789.1 dimethylhistidine N-methyltransferase [Variovorax sp. Sphag1AA]